MRERVLNLDYLKDFIPEEKDKISKYRPQCLYIPRPPARRKYQTAIRAPDRNFFHIMTQRNVYLWIIAKKDMSNGYRQKIQLVYKCVKSLAGFQNLPICTTFEQCNYWVNQCPCQIVLFEDIFDQAFNGLKDKQNAVGFHIISSENVKIAQISRQNRKIRDLYDNEEFILTVARQNMQRLAINKQQKDMEKGVKGGDEFKRLLIRNIIFPNFIKLSKHDKSQHNQYRLHLIGLRKLTEDDKLASKQKFVQSCKEQFNRQKFPNDYELIEQYNSNTFQDPKDILRFYTLDSFFYKVLNNTLRIAKNTEEFYSIGEPFNRVFDAIKSEYDAAKSFSSNQMIVYRGADLTASECSYLQQNVGRYIQINGFISTSKNLQTAKSFARQRKNNTIFKINLRKVDKKYQQYDYGYVDLQLNKCSAFDQDEVLINALNVFKILGKQQLDSFDIYSLEYGSIFKVLDQNPDKLTQNDRYAYYSFKELKEMNQQVKDMGQVYLRTNQPQKAVQIYEFQLEKIKSSLQIVHREEIQNVMIKAADAYLANGQPDKALQYYESILGKKSKRTNQRRKSKILSGKQIARDQAELYQISAKLSSIQTNTDKFEDAELNYTKASKQIQAQLTKQWSLSVLWPKIELQWQIFEGKKSQLLYQQAFNILKSIDKNLHDALNKMKNKYEPYEQKKIRLKLTQVYESMAQMTQKLQSSSNSISQIRSSFDSILSDLRPLIQKNSYQQGVLNIRRSEILRRTKDFKQQQVFQNYRMSINLVQSNTVESDKILPMVYNGFADLQRKIKKKQDNIEVKKTFKKKLKVQTFIYGSDDPKPLLTKMDIAICQREDKNTIQSLEQFSDAFHTKLFKSEKKYSTHAKILFNMAQAYTDKGDDGLAMKNYQQAYQILKKRLSSKDFEKSVLRFKIKLKIGRLYIGNCLRSEQNLKLAQKNLLQYHRFITNFYKYPHTDVGMSHNFLGALYSTQRRFGPSKQNFLLSIDIYEQVVGKTSLDVAKIKSNLAICFAQLKDQSKATQYLLSSQSIFQKIYSDLRKFNPFTYESQFIKGEIQTILGQYQKAIESCQSSIQTEKQFLQAKRKNAGGLIKIGSNSNLPQTILSKNDSYQLRAQLKRPQYQSVNVNISKNEENALKYNLQSQNPQKRNQLQKYNYNYNSIVNYMTEHGFRCQFKICECLIHLKKYQEARNRLEKLKFNINKRILEQKINVLFKDNVYSKKQLYLQKSDQYIKTINRALQSRQKRLQRQRNKKQKQKGQKDNKQEIQKEEENNIIQNIQNEHINF